MRGSNGTNPGAGHRRLGARSHARLLDEQTDGLCRSLRAEERLIAAGKVLAEVLVEIRASQSHMVAANERASTAVYEAPTSMLAVAA